MQITHGRDYAFWRDGWIDGHLLSVYFWCTPLCLLEVAAPGPYNPPKVCPCLATMASASASRESDSAMICGITLPLLQRLVCHSRSLFITKTQSSFAGIFGAFHIGPSTTPNEVRFPVLGSTCSATNLPAGRCMNPLPPPGRRMT